MKWLNNSVHVLSVAALVTFAACTKEVAPTSPEGALERYVKIAFNAKSEKDQKALYEMSEEDAKSWLGSMSDETFKKQFIENQMQLVSFKTSDKRENKNGGVSLIYELVFKDGKGPTPLTPGSDPSAATYTNKKIAYLKQVDGAWKITATKNVKTYIERKDALEVPPLSGMPPTASEE